MIDSQPEFQLIRKPIRRMYLRVLPPDGRIQVTAPQKTTEKQVRQLIADKQVWITQQQDRIQQMDVYPCPDLQQCKQILHEVVPPLLQHWQTILGVTCLNWQVRQMKARWGSCLIQQQKIHLNSQLACLPEPLIELVLVHELLHLKERYHNARFYGMLEDALPDWRVREQQLQNSYIVSTKCQQGSLSLP